MYIDTCIYFAQQMLGVDDLPYDLYCRLERVQALLQKVKPEGGLVSTQVVASVVEQWEREQG